MKHITFTRIAVVILAGVAVQHSASALSVNLTSSQYRTSLARGELSGAPFENRTNFGAGPISDAYVSSAPTDWVECEANADLFKVSTSANAVQHEIYRGHSEAFAGIDFNFTPVAAATTTIDLKFFMAGQFAWGGNEACLTDLTTGNILWNFYDQGIGGGNISWDYHLEEVDATANISVVTEFLADHDYRLCLSSWGTSSVPDFDQRTAEVCGLEVAVPAVPEPTVGAMIAIAATGLFLRRKRS